MQRIGVAPFDTGIPTYIEDAWQPKCIHLPLRQHIGAPATPAVKVGQTVAVGDLVAAANGMISANIHSSVNGCVTAVTDTEIVIQVQA